MDDAYVRRVDLAALHAVGRNTQTLLDRDSGAKTLSLMVIKTPPGEGSPAGMHTHAVDQLFYVISGMMSIEIGGERTEAGPGSLVIFPAGVPHRNWNGGTEPIVHVAIASPVPEAGVPFATPVPA